MSHGIASSVPSCRTRQALSHTASQGTACAHPSSKTSLLHLTLWGIPQGDNKVGQTRAWGTVGATTEQGRCCHRQCRWDPSTERSPRSRLWSCWPLTAFPALAGLCCSLQAVKIRGSRTCCPPQAVTRWPEHSLSAAWLGTTVGMVAWPGTPLAEAKPLSGCL